MNRLALKSICKGFSQVGAIKSSYLFKGKQLSYFSNTVKFVFAEGSSGNNVEVEGQIGKTLLDVALDNNIDIEGACGGELACSTCHVIVSDQLYPKLPAKKEEEDDMLDLAWGLTDTSRLCCQLKVTKEIEGQVFKVPAETNNML